MPPQKVLEAVADIAYTAGGMAYFSGDSRQDVSQFILWAQQFEQEHRTTDWDEVDYLTEIEKFTISKIHTLPDGKQ